MAANRLKNPLGRLLLAACFTVTGLMASEHHGVVKSGGIPVPGATVTATNGDKKSVTTTDETGYYAFPELADGVWTVTVDSLGFAKASRDVGIAPDAPSPMWDLKYLTLQELTAPPAEATPTPAPGAPATTAAAGEKPAEAAKPAETPAAPATAPATPATTAAAGKNAKNAKNSKNSKTPATPAAGANGRPSLNASLAAAGQGQGGGFTRVGVNQAGGGDAALNADAGGPPGADAGDMGNQSFTINGSVSSGLDMQQPGGDWMGGRGGPGGPGGDMGGMGPGGIPGMPGGDPNNPNATADAGGGRGGRGGGAPGGGGPGGAGGRGGGGAAGMMAGIPNIGGGGGRGGGGRGGAGGAGGRGGRNPASFGNNRRDPRARYNFAASLNGFTNSALNARSYSITGQEVNKPSAQTLRSTLTAGGPLKIPHLFDTHNKGTFSINYSLTRNRNASLYSSLVPTDAERAGNFSNVLVNGGTGAGLVPVTLYNGTTPIPGNIIPANLISPVAAALLKYYPEPNFTGGTASSPLNYESSSTGYTSGDNVNARLGYTFNTKNQINGNVAWQRQKTTTPSEFAAVVPAWSDIATNNGLSTSVSYIYHFSARLIATTHYNYSKSHALTTPYFANTTNVSGNLGIVGNDQLPIDFGPPGVGFRTSGLLSLGATNPSYSHPQTSAVGESLLWVHAAHEFTFGGDYSRREANTESQNNPRGSWGFTGQATALNGNTANTGTGYDLADFLLGTPDTMSLNVANSLRGNTAAQLMQYPSGSVPANLLALENTPSGGDRYLRTSVYDIFVNDQWRLTPRLSLSLGVRWDYQAPTTELYNRLATIDLPGTYQVSAATYAALPATGLSVVAGQKGPVTGYQYSDSMLNGKKNDISPRIGFAYKPWSKHSTVIRGGWGLYFIPSIYSNLVGQLDAQTPFGTAYNLNNNCGANLQNAFSLSALSSLGCVASNTATTTNAMNPNFRVGYTQNWQLAVQQNLVFNTVATVTYFASKGTGLPQSFYPNSYVTTTSSAKTASSLFSPYCASGDLCPVGYVYESSNGNSSDEAVQFQLQRRLRTGFGASVSYLFNKALDDTPNVSEDWQNLELDKARTAGIRNQTLSFNMQYSTGVGARGGALTNGFKGVLLKDWTVMPSVVLASGAPINITDSQLTLGGTTASSLLRADFTGQPTFVNGRLNIQAFAAPNVTFGSLGRDTLNGPKQFSTNLSANRTFRLADRKNITFSVQMQNPINHPTVSSWYTSLISTQFGATSGYSGMRTISANMRFNF